MQVLLSAIVSALTSLVIVVLTYYLTFRQEARKVERSARELVNFEYLNPLRLYLVESHYRLGEISRLVSEEGRLEALMPINVPQEVSDKDPEWFNGRGCYLVSSSYLTACLFAYLKKLREDFPYLQLTGKDDTQLLALLLRISVGFLQDGGIYYATQPSIGEDLLVRNENRIKTYREFCTLLQDPLSRVWMDRLINFYLETARGKKLQRVEQTLTAIEAMSEFLDEAVGGGASIKERIAAEGIRSL